MIAVIYVELLQQCSQAALDRLRLPPTYLYTIYNVSNPKSITSVDLQKLFRTKGKPPKLDTGVDPVEWTVVGLEKGAKMPKGHLPYPEAFRQQILELIRAGRTPGSSRFLLWARVPL